MNILSKIVYAQELVTNAATLVQRINKFIINPLIVFIFALALVYFLWGMVEYMIHANEGLKRKESGQHILWGLIGMTIMVGVFAIMNIITSTLGVNPGVFNPQAGAGQEFVDLKLQP